MKKNIISVLFILLACCVLGADKPKYIFYFIGDGMGTCVVNTTEAYLSALENKVGNTKVFADIPLVGVATTNASNRYITDSAAAGTALAVGEKTSPGTIGMNEDHSGEFKSIAIKAKENNMAVGILTSVSIDHATPASFYAHRPDRNMHYEIMMDGTISGIDILGGSGFIKPAPKDKEDGYKIFAEKGYKIANGKEAITNFTPKKSDNIIITERKDADQESFAYTIDKKEEDLQLADIVEFSYKHLYNKNKNGFFIMAEGGKIDWAAHSNDAATAIHEVISLDEAVKKAFEFYKQHPTQTLIIITADHETGGMSLGIEANGYQSKLSVLSSQKISLDKLSKIIPACKSWNEAYEILKDKLSIGSSFKVSDKQLSQMKEIFETSPKKLSGYVVKLINDQSSIGWTTGSHTGSPVFVYALGAGAEEFKGYIDNTDIPNKIGKMITGK